MMTMMTATATLTPQSRIRQRAETMPGRPTKRRKTATMMFSTSHRNRRRRTSARCPPSPMTRMRTRTRTRMSTCGQRGVDSSMTRPRRTTMTTRKMTMMVALWRISLMIRKSSSTRRRSGKRASTMTKRSLTRTISICLLKILAKMQKSLRRRTTNALTFVGTMTMRRLKTPPRLRAQPHWPSQMMSLWSRPRHRRIALTDWMTSRTRTTGLSMTRRQKRNGRSARQRKRRVGRK
mmetsp:Transcript_34323/g.103503  ORF Transcript_34323/g.103503 Transcript_34323/m.103503 type:complete len:235 (-) Transcript_34323:3823-4527(-)